VSELLVPFAKAQAAEALASHAPDWVRQDRLAALQLFETTPVESSPLFNRHVITDGAPVQLVELAPAATQGPATHALESDWFDGVAKVVDGAVTEAALSKSASARGVRLTSIFSALAGDPAFAREMLTLGATIQADKFFQLTRALYQDGVLLDVPAGVRLERPLRINFVQHSPKLASFGRVVARLHKGASVQIFESQESGIDAPAVVGVGCEADVGEGAELHYSAMGNFGAGVGLFINRKAAVGAHGRVHWSLGNFGGALTKSMVHTSLNGNDSSVKHTEVVFGAGSQKFDISSFVTHIGHRAKSDVLSRAALRHKSRGNVKGMITIDHRGLNADSYLGQFALLLDPEAKSVAIPGLEIETSQVIRAKHAAAVQQIDENHVFYLQSRGIPEQTARRLIVEGFLHPVIAGLGSEALQSEVLRIIASKWG
jgi:Fe-S cluster assembly scaffold protein SufB